MSDRSRSIVHIDLDAFYAAVEVLEDPSLAGKPLLVGGRPQERGVVATASYPARDFGVHSAMPMSQALRLCPHAIVVPPRHGLYREYSRRVMAILHRTTPRVEQLSIDEAYLDLTERVEAWEEGVEIARRLQARVRQEAGLSASLGLATNKQVAKVASDHDKPAGLTVVRPGEEAAFLAPLPVRALWGLGPVAERRLAALGVRTVGQLAQMPARDLEDLFGQRGRDLARRARGLDERPVVTEHERKSVSQERTFSRDLRGKRALKRQLWRLSGGVAERLERIDLVGGTVTIKLRYADFTTLTRQMTLDVPTADRREIYRAALVLFERAWQRDRPVRLLGVAASQLSPPTGQLRLL